MKRLLVLLACLVGAGCDGDDSRTSDGGMEREDAGAGDASTPSGRDGGRRGPTDSGADAVDSGPDAMADAEVAACDGGGQDEVCNDGVDNDCDGLLDETSGCTARYDRCDDPLDITGGGSFLVSLTGTHLDEPDTGPISSRSDIVVRFRLEEASEVDLRAQGSRGNSGIDAVISLRTACDAASEVEPAAYGRVRVRRLPAGEYFAVIAVPRYSQFVAIDFAFGPPRPLPENWVCGGAIDVSGGGSFHGSALDLDNAVDDSCAPDKERLYYKLTLGSESDVELSLTNDASRWMIVLLGESCDFSSSPALPVECTYGTALHQRLHRVPAGTYFIAVAGNDVDFDLNVAVLDPTPWPDGVSCDAPPQLALGAVVQSSLQFGPDPSAGICSCDATATWLRDVADFVDLDCGYVAPQAVYQLDVTAPSDLRLELDSGRGGLVLDFELRGACASSGSRLTCGGSGNSSLRNVPAGTYYLFVSGNTQGSFSVRVDALPVTEPTPASANATCATAVPIPATGGVFTGSTADTGDDFDIACRNTAAQQDAVFQLELAKRSSVLAAARPISATGMAMIAYRLERSCERPRVSCRRDGVVPATAFSETLEPGTYYYVVEGWAADALAPKSGEYIFDVQVIEQ